MEEIEFKQEQYFRNTPMFRLVTESMDMTQPYSNVPLKEYAREK